MNYPEQIDTILNKELDLLIEAVRNKEYAFDEDIIKKYYEMYEQITKSQK